MSIATKIGTVLGTTTAYIVHYGSKCSTPLGVASLVFVHRDEIVQFASNHALEDKSDEAISDNLFKCLEFID